MDSPLAAKPDLTDTPLVEDTHTFNHGAAAAVDACALRKNPFYGPLTYAFDEAAHKPQRRI